MSAMKRRNLIKGMALTSLAAVSASNSSLIMASNRKLKLLVMGGTGFLGPHTVNAALAQGHQVTLFNRGKTNPGMFKQLESIKGDRNTEDINQLSGRYFDAVIDTSAYYPRSINMALEVLKENIKQYLFVSTISVYADWSKPDMDESAPLGSIDDPDTEEVTGETYGPLKALCEQAAEKHMPGRVSIIRPGLIVGPGDKTDRFTYWPVRVKHGGEVLAPGDAQDVIQYVNVGDLSEWMVHCINNQITAVFNAQTNGSDITIGRLLETCVTMLNPETKLTWVPAEFLESHEVAPWQEMPTWLPAKGEYAGAGTMSSQKAYANGLRERPMRETIQDTYDWFASLPEERRLNLRAGISAEKEEKVLKAWHQQQ
jgi:nucleoside-diphosphate-sugar epimerase